MSSGPLLYWQREDVTLGTCWEWRDELRLILLVRSWVIKELMCLGWLFNAAKRLPSRSHGGRCTGKTTR